MDMKVIYDVAGYPPPKGHRRAYSRWLKRVQGALSLAGWRHEPQNGIAHYVKYCRESRKLTQVCDRRK